MLVVGFRACRPHYAMGRSASGRWQAGSRHSLLELIEMDMQRGDQLLPVSVVERRRRPRLSDEFRGMNQTNPQSLSTQP